MQNHSTRCITGHLCKAYQRCGLLGGSLLSHYGFWSLIVWCLRSNRSKCRRPSCNSSSRPQCGNKHLQQLQPSIANDHTMMTLDGVINARTQLTLLLDDSLHAMQLEAREKKIVSINLRLLTRVQCEATTTFTLCSLPSRFQLQCILHAITIPIMEVTSSRNFSR